MYVFVYFFLLVSVSQAQTTNIRELQKQIENSEGTKKLQFLLDAADYYMRVAPDSGLQYSDEALILASQLNDKKLVAKANYLSGMSNLQLKKNSQAWQDFSKSIAYAQKQKDWSLVARNMIGQAQVHYNTLSFDSARVILESAELLSVEQKFDDLLPGIYQNKARIYDKEGNLTVAIDYYLKAAALFEAQNRESDLAEIDGNIGVVYMRLENEPEALKYLTRAMEYNEKNNNWVKLSNNYNNLGALYQQMDSLKKSRFYYEKELELAIKEGNEYSLARTYLNFAKLWRLLQRYRRI
jgi:tetratricopeptide (TPR) repeat protein